MTIHELCDKLRTDGYQPELINVKIKHAETGTPFDWQIHVRKDCKYIHSFLYTNKVLEDGVAAYNATIFKLKQKELKCQQRKQTH